MADDLIGSLRAERRKLARELREFAAGQRTAWADVLDSKVKTEWMTVREAAGILELGAAGVRRLLQIGRLGGRKVGQRWLASAKWVEFERQRRTGKLTAEDAEDGGGVNENCKLQI